MRAPTLLCPLARFRREDFTSLPHHPTQVRSAPLLYGTESHLRREEVRSRAYEPKRHKRSEEVGAAAPGASAAAATEATSTK